MDLEQSGISEQPSPPLGSEPMEHGTPPSTSPATKGPPPSFILALGRVQPRFPSLALEKEFAQATGRAETAGLTDPQVLQSILADRTNRYLTRQMCWVFTIEGLETYILIPRDPGDFELLIEAVRAEPHPTDIDVIIGMRGPNASPEVCSGLMVPVVLFDQLYSFDRDELIDAIPRPEMAEEEEPAQPARRRGRQRREGAAPENEEGAAGEEAERQFRAMAGELLDRIMQIADNAGATDEHRALNYLAVRYPAIYARTAEANRAEFSMTGVDVRPSRLSGIRKVVDVIFSYTHRRTNMTEKYFVRVDVTEEFPFLVTPLSPFYER
jgi:hypothetical protein